jgi:hypothetical protein
MCGFQRDPCEDCESNWKGHESNHFMRVMFQAKENRDAIDLILNSPVFQCRSEAMIPRVNEGM